MESLKPRRFGIELELSRRLLCVNNTDRHYSRSWGEVEQILYNLRASDKIQRGWKLKTDTSCGGEIVSPILHGGDGLRQAANICYEINKYTKNIGKSPVDGECGLHLHFDAGDMRPRQLSNLFVLLHMAEPVIFAMYPNRNMNYCAPIDVNMRLASRFRDWVDVRDTWYRSENNVKDKRHAYTRNFINGASAGDYYDGTRYHGFNIHCYWRQGTVEFRYGNGTFDPLHIRAYYEMCLSMVNTAMTKKKIKLPDAVKDMAYNDLRAYYSGNYRFRKLINKLCKECSFSRNTIKLIMSLVKKNKPMLLAKTPKGDSDLTIIDRRNVSKYIFIGPDGVYYSSNGNTLVGNALTRAMLLYEVVSVVYDQFSGRFNRPRLISSNPKYKIKYNIYARHGNNPVPTLQDFVPAGVAIANPNPFLGEAVGNPVVEIPAPTHEITLGDNTFQVPPLNDAQAEIWNALNPAEQQELADLLGHPYGDQVQQNTMEDNA